MADHIQAEAEALSSAEQKEEKLLAARAETEEQAEAQAQAALEAVTSKLAAAEARAAAAAEAPASGLWLTEDTMAVYSTQEGSGARKCRQAKRWKSW